MELLIKLPEGYVGTVMRNQKINGSAMDKMLRQAVIDGIPLPKGHGRLIDAVAYKEEMLNSREFDFFKRIDMQPTIIEADKEQ